MTIKIGKDTTSLGVEYPVGILESGETIELNYAPAPAVEPLSAQNDHALIVGYLSRANPLQVAGGYLGSILPTKKEDTRFNYNEYLQRWGDKHDPSDDVVLDRYQHNGVDFWIAQAANDPVLDSSQYVNLERGAGVWIPPHTDAYDIYNVDDMAKIKAFFKILPNEHGDGYVLSPILGPFQHYMDAIEKGTITLMPALKKALCGRADSSSGLVMTFKKFIATREEQCSNWGEAFSVARDFIKGHEVVVRALLPYYEIEENRKKALIDLAERSCTMLNEWSASDCFGVVIQRHFKDEKGAVGLAAYDINDCDFKNDWGYTDSIWESTVDWRSEKRDYRNFEQSLALLNSEFQRVSNAVIKTDDLEEEIANEPR